MGFKNIQKIEDLPAGSPVQVDLSAGLDIIFENLGGIMSLRTWREESI